MAEEKQKKRDGGSNASAALLCGTIPDESRFIYNALETISGMALLGGAAEVSNAVCECAALFRANVKADPPVCYAGG